MLRISITRPLLAAGLACALGAPPAAAQLEELQEYKEHRYEFTPFAAYQWGGSFDTDAFGTVPSGDLTLNDSFGWGAILGFMVQPGTAFEITYLRQDTDVFFEPSVGGSTDLGGFAMNYIQAGGSQAFGHGKLKPFLDFSAGINILDPKTDGLDSDTRFSWSVGGGAKYMFESGRVGLRMDGRLWITPVPSGDYGVWCDYFGCFVTEGTAWVTQGTLSGGLILAF